MDNYHWGMWGAVATTSTTLRSTCPPAGEPSWEEQAFARDAAGHLGAGCVWPPRSYTCTFCRREFRSAQALGGHMNVHRRDRARLRQCASPPDHQVQTQPTSPHDRQHLQPDNLYRAGAATLLSSPRSLKDQQAMISSTSPSYISTIIKESKNKVFISMSADATVMEAAESGDEEGRTKRRRVDQPPAVALPLFLRPPASCERADGDAKVPKAIPSPSPSGSLNLVGRQEVDLELRLGTSTPKVA